MPVVFLNETIFRKSIFLNASASFCFTRETKRTVSCETLFFRLFFTKIPDSGSQLPVLCLFSSSFQFLASSFQCKGLSLNTYSQGYPQQTQRFSLFLMFLLGSFM